MTAAQPPSRLGRSLGLGGAVVVGVSAMVGTGVFAVWQPAIERAGGLLVVAVLIAMVVAALNATSTARLAARHPQAGGVYTYGRARLGRVPGVLAGVVFLIGKTASASAAALTIGLYVWPDQSKLVSLAAIVGALALNLRGIVRSTRVAGVLVALVIAVLVVLVASAAVSTEFAGRNPVPGPSDGWHLLAASALVFVAFAGYARITVLGEEVRDPARVIPAAVAVSFFIVAIVYVAIAVVVETAAASGVVVGPAALSDIASVVGGNALVGVVAVAAVLAAGAVLMNLVAGVGRTLFAMSDAGDGPRVFAAVGARSSIPVRAELAAALGAGVLVLVGGLTFSLALSAGMILTYYGIAHLSALRLERRPGAGGWLLAATPLVGLAGCVALVVAVIVAG